MIILLCNGLYGLPGIYDRGGLHVQAQAGGWRVGLLVDGFPAAEAGLKEGDLITTIDGQSPRLLSAARLYQKPWGPAGPHIVLIVKDQAMTATLRGFL